MKPILFSASLVILIGLALFFHSLPTGNTLSTSGYWSGIMLMNGKTVDASIDLTSSPPFFSSNDLMLLDQPVTDLTISGDSIRFSLVLDVDILFEGRVFRDTMAGIATVIGAPPIMQIRFTLEKQAGKPAKSYTIEHLYIRSEDARLSADIYKPDTDTVHPAILLLPGSNRDNPRRNLAFYADFFANLGFEALIFDKRGSGESTGNSITATYKDLTNDAIACLSALKNRKSVNPEKIGMLGISQGGMLLPYIVSISAIPSFIICISPEIVGMHEAAAYSDSLQVIRRGFSHEEGHLVAECHREVASLISKGSDYEDIENYIHSHAQRHGFMNFTGLYETIDIEEESFKGAYWQGRTYTFYPYWKSIQLKTLCIFGEDDDLVDPVKNVDLLHRLLKENIQVHVFPDANHIMKRSFNHSNEADIDFPRMTEGYTDYLAKWITNNLN